MKSSVTLRKREGKKGISLYLDIYSRGVRTYEYLNLYLKPGKSEKENNNKILQFAQEIRAKREIEVLENKAHLSDPNFCDYLEGLKLTYFSRIVKSVRPTVRLSEVDNNVFNELQQYMNSIMNLKPSTIRTYLAIIKSKINTAKKNGYKVTDQHISIQSYNPTEREYLTLDEIKVLYEDLKTNKKKSESDDKLAFFFCCLTGLRYSDAKKLNWNEFKDVDGRKRIVFTQKKTKEVNYLEINQQAYSLIKDREKDEGNVFKISSPARVNIVVKKWIKDCGINKKITFHCSRHSFAMLMMSLNIDLYTVSKLLGHKKISNTQIYARMLDKRKQEAVDLIPEIIM
ncbi:MAG: site-specific integrase [Paludibacteraceae bacterium]|nr:site-specific integrase [Paludibacteraceae bacterium]